MYSTMSWFRVINADAAERKFIPQIIVSGYIGVALNDEPPVLFTAFRESFVQLESSHARCELLINSGGGDMTTAFAMFDLIKNSPMVVDVIIYGMAASSAAWLALAGDSVSMTDNAMLMLHKPQAGAGGESGNLRSVADYMDKLEGRVAEIVSAKTGKPIDQVKAEWLKSNTQTWFTAKEALEAGLIDTIVNPMHQAAAVSNSYKSVDDAWNTYKAFNSCLNAVATKPNTDTKTENIMIKPIISVLNLHKVQHTLTENSTEADVQAVLNGVLQTNAELNKKLEDVAIKAAAELKAKATTLVENAVKDGKITEAEKADWVKNAEQNYDFVALALGKMQGRVDVNNTLDPNKDKNAAGGEKPATDPNNKDSWTLRQWEQKDPNGLRSMMVSNKAKYDQLFEKEYGVKP